MVEPLLHVTSATAWSSGDGGHWSPPSPATPGRVTLCTARQAPGLARLLHAGTVDLVLLVVDPRRLDAAPVAADPYGIGLELAQVPAPLPRAAVVDVVPFPPGPGGRWARPDVAPLA